MSHKKKNTSSRGFTWCNYYPRKTKTKQEKIKNLEKKYKKYLTNE